MTPKNEALNLVMSKVAPKHLVFSWSHSLKDHVALVVALDLIGYFKTITTLLQYILHQNSFELMPVESLFKGAGSFLSIHEKTQGINSM